MVNVYRGSLIRNCLTAFTNLQKYANVNSLRPFEQSFFTSFAIIRIFSRTRYSGIKSNQFQWCTWVHGSTPTKSTIKWSLKFYRLYFFLLLNICVLTLKSQECPAWMTTVFTDYTVKWCWKFWVLAFMLLLLWHILFSTRLKFYVWVSLNQRRGHNDQDSWGGDQTGNNWITSQTPNSWTMVHPWNVTLFSSRQLLSTVPSSLALVTKMLRFSIGL